MQVLRDLGKSVGQLFPGTWNKFLFRSFWGEALLTSDAYFVIDSYEDVRLRSCFQREAETGDTSARKAADPYFSGSARARDPIHGTFSPQAAAMLTELFLRHAGKAPRISTDTEVGHKRDAILICYGTADANFKTFDIEATSGSELCRFSFDGKGQRAFRIGGQIHSMEKRGGVTYDKAILLRLAHGRDANHSHVVCAGLSEWGSLAAVHYLTNNWKALHKRFDGFGQRRDFCVLLEVPCGQFENAREVTSAVWWEPKAERRSELVSASAGPVET